MAVGPTHDRGSAVAGPRPPLLPRGHTRRPVRLAVTFVVASGLAITAGCTPTPGTDDPGAPPPAAAPATSVPPRGSPPDAAPAPPTTEPAGIGTTNPGATTSAPTATPAPATSSTTPPPDPARQTLRLGDSGSAVGDLQEQLSDLGYWLGEPDSHYGQLTRQALMAFQKAEGLTRDGVAGPRTRERLPDASRPEPRSDSGDVIEVDLERQLLLVVRDGELKWAFNTSTGNGEAYDRPSGGTGVARTPRGEFEIERQIDGLRKAELGELYRPKYFHGGIAVHGSGSVPARPASHGCVRLTNAAMDLLWESGVAEIGTDVLVY
jgi:hypothetical protein